MQLSFKMKNTYTWGMCSEWSRNLKEQAVMGATLESRTMNFLIKEFIACLVKLEVVGVAKEPKRKYI